MARMALRITGPHDLAAAVRALTAADPRLAAPAAAIGALPLRLQAPGLPGLLRIVVGQQLSVASATAVWGKVAAAYPGFDPAAIAAASEADLRGAGLSRQKARTFQAVAAAVAQGLDLEALALADAAQARDALEAIRGIGPWTADLYLMFCAGHPDILPVGDLAVRRGAQFALGLPQEPPPDALAEIGAIWSPHRSTAARLFWATYKAVKAPTATAPTEREAAGYPL